MPVSPYTWQANDFLTANRLNSELRQTGGKPFLPNGPGWHAAKPVYKAVAAATPAAPTASAWTSMFAATPGTIWEVISDSGSFMGARGDPISNGLLSWQRLANGGGAAGVQGGLALFMANQSFIAGSAGTISTGIGVNSGTTPTSIGTQQSINGSFVNSVFAVDIIDSNTAGVTGWYISSAAGLTPTATEPDGSGWVARLQGFWASAYPGNGGTSPSVPTPVSNWTGTSPSLSAAMMNGPTGIAQLMNLLNQPPLLRCQASSTTSCPTGTATTINLGTPSYDTYSAWNNSTNTYTVPLSGVYLVAGFVPWLSFPSAGSAQAGISINGTSHLGPVQQVSSGTGAGPAKIQIFDLNAGDTIQLQGTQGSGSTLSTASGFLSPILVILYLGAQGVPSPLPSVPDITYKFLAGTPASSMPGVMNASVANDLNFLNQKPYLLSSQAASQTGIAMSTGTRVSMDTISGAIHGANGDNYSGWSAGSHFYSAPRNGWYLAVQEVIMNPPSLTTAPSNAAGFMVNPGGAVASEWYQQQNARVGGSTGGGAAAIGLFYLRAGDNIAPSVFSQGTSATTTSTFAGGSHFEVCWVSS